MMHILTAHPFVALFLALLALLGFLTVRALKNAPLVEDDQATPELPFPGPIVIDRALSERMAKQAAAHEREVAELRQSQEAHHA